MSPVAAIPERLNVADYFLDRHLREGRGHRLAVAGVGERLSYAELAERTSRVAASWRRMGIEPGDRVLLILPDSPEFIACFFGTLKVGAVAVPVNPFTRAADYAYYLADCQPRLVVVHTLSYSEAMAALAQAASPPRIVTVGKEVAGCDQLEELLAAPAVPLEAHPTRADDTAFFLYTSGSGGQPKAAVHRHRHMLVTAGAFATQVLGIRSDDVTFSASKLFFAYGLGNGMYFPFSVGAATVLLPEKPTPEHLLDVLQQYRPTLFFSVPTLYGALLHATEGTRVSLDFLRLAVSAGEALPAEIFERFRFRFGIEILDGIGTTEMLHMFISSRPGSARPGSCGRVVPDYEVRIVGDAAEDVPAGEIGNLWVKGESMFAGYWGQPELTAHARRGDWYVTGDKFYCDADSFFHYCGRADDMMKVSGMWVSPLEVENALLAHDAVAEAAVVGQPGADGLLQVVAYVVLRQGSVGAGLVPARAANPKEIAISEELRRFVRQRLPGYKVPAVVHFVPELPKTATGKIQRFKLRAEPA